MITIKTLLEQAGKMPPEKKKNNQELDKMKDFKQGYNSAHEEFGSIEMDNILRKAGWVKVDKILDRIEFVYGKEAMGRGVKQLYHKGLKTIISVKEKYTGLKPNSFDMTKPPTQPKGLKVALDNTFGMFLKDKDNPIYLNIRNQALAQIQKILKDEGYIKISKQFLQKKEVIKMGNYLRDPLYQKIHKTVANMTNELFERQGKDKDKKIETPDFTETIEMFIRLMTKTIYTDVKSFR